MSRSERLLALIQALRRHRQPVAAARLAVELEVSIRTVYRDIGALVAQGAQVEGEAGIGYVLRPGFVLPPLMFSDQEIESLVLGSRWVMKNADADLAAAARDAMAKIMAVLPADLRERAEFSGLVVASYPKAPPEQIDLEPIRGMIRAEHRMTMRYADVNGALTERTVWPIALAFFDRVRIVAAWCELRQDFRHFRTDRIQSATDTGQRYPRRRRVLAKEWRAKEGMSEQE